VDPLFVEEPELIFEREAVSCRRESLFGLADGRWDAFLESNKAWLNTSLLIAQDGRQVLSVLPGPVVTVEMEREPSVNLSMERRPLVLT
jgi:hypothetical protein